MAATSALARVTVVVLALALAALASGCSRDAEPRRPAAPASLARSVPGTPVAVADVDGSPWIALADRHVLVRSGEPEVHLPGAPQDLVATPFGVWVSIENGTSGYLVRVDPSTGRIDRRVSLTDDDTRPGDLASDGLRLWVIDEARVSTIVVDARSGRVGARILVDNAPADVAWGLMGVFETGGGSGSLAGLDPDRGVSTQAMGQVCNDPQGLAVADSRVWVACTSGDRVAVVDPVQHMVSDVRLPRPATVVLTRTHALVILETGPTVAVIDRVTERVVRRVALGRLRGPVDHRLDATVSGRELVLTHPGADRVWRVPLARLLPGA